MPNFIQHKHGDPVDAQTLLYMLERLFYATPYHQVSGAVKDRMSRFQHPKATCGVVKYTSTGDGNTFYQAFQIVDEKAEVEPITIIFKPGGMAII